MFGMIRRYLRGRARIIARAQMKNALKKVAKGIRDGKDSNDSANANANAIKGNARKKSALGTQIMAIIVSASLIAPYNVNAFMGVGDTAVVHDPTTFAGIIQQGLDAIEKYNSMIKTAQDTLDTMNKINDMTNAANNMLNNLQTGIADPRQLYNRFQQNLENIKETSKRFAENLQKRDWVDTFYRNEMASCQNKWARVKKEFERQRLELEREQELESSKYEGDDENQKILAEVNKYSIIEKYNQQAEALDRESNWLDNAFTNGWADANKKSNDALDYAISKIDITKNENLNYEEEAKAKLAKLKKEKQVAMGQQNNNKEERTAKFCANVEKLELAAIYNDYSNCYYKAIKENNKKEAKRCFNGMKDTKIKESQARIDNLEIKIERKGNTFKKFISTGKSSLATLDIDENNGNLLPSAKEWKDKYGKEPTSVAEPMTITVTKKDSDGKETTTNEQRWVAKLEVIKHLQSDFPQDALYLQNKRNMLTALQGDTLAIQKSQLETAIQLNNSIDELKMIMAEMGEAITDLAYNDKIKAEERFKDDLEEYSKAQEHLENKYKFKDNALFEYEYGKPKLKRNNYQQGDNFLE